MILKKQNKKPLTTYIKGYRVESIIRSSIVNQSLKTQWWINREHSIPMQKKKKKEKKRFLII